MKTNYMAAAIASGFNIENTGGGCQWLRRGLDAITNGEAGLPDGGSVLVVSLNADGDYDDSMPPVEFPSLDAALAFLNAPAFQKI